MESSLFDLLRIWSKRIRTFACWYQKRMPYHLAILHMAWGRGGSEERAVQGRGEIMDIEIDSLPDDLIYKILSYVDIVYSVRLSVLSSRWRFIWTSMPNLKFQRREVYSRSSSRYHEFVNNVLSVRNKIDVSSVSLDLAIDDFYDLRLSVERILEYAFSHNVQQLCISVENFEIPPSQLSSKSLKHLTIKHLTIKKLNTAVDCLSYWPALTTLHLDRVSLRNCSTSILAMCHNLKNLTLERCKVYERKNSGGFRAHGFTIINSRLLSLTLKKVDWEVGFVLVDTPQLKNLILVDKSQRELFYRISDLSGVTISARDLTYLRIKGAYFPKLFLDGFPSLEKVDLCISSLEQTDVHEICDLFQRLHSVKSLALSLEIVELLSTSKEVITHQPSPFPSLESLKIYPLEGLETFMLHELRTYRLKSSLDLFTRQLDQEQEAMKIKLSAEVTKYLLDNTSSNATFTMVSHEEARAIRITKVAHRLMAALWKYLEEMEAYTEAKVEWKKTLADSYFQDFETKIWPRGETREIFYMLQNIKLLLTNLVPASKRVEMQACFSRLSAKSKTVVNKIVADMKNQCDIKQRIFSGYFDEIA